ncbi:STAS domain-containing protein [Kitasatospora sp. NPDC004745]|uniref:STAS domain-containing protein n=1 Tax=Kitasatospora sp. NPDC004745 TaxID=3364019 RepID=UPI00368E1DDE
MTRRPRDAQPVPETLGFTAVARPWERGTVLTLVGELDLDTAGALTVALDAVLAVPGTVVVLDCAGLEFCDSSGLNVMLRAHKRAVAGGGRVELARPRPMVLRMLELTGATHALPVRDSVPE